MVMPFYFLRALFSPVIRIEVAMNYAQEQRIRLIEVIIDNCGMFNRAILMDYFGISKPQASRDLRDYMTLAPNNLLYDKTNKTYVKSTSFKRVYNG